MLSKLDLIVVWCLLSEKMLPCVIENFADILFAVQLKYIVCVIFMHVSHLSVSVSILDQRKLIRRLLRWQSCEF